MKIISTLALLVVLSSCIPIKIAPRIKEDKIKIGKRFKRQLSKDYTFIFKDPKDENEFYNYINIKYDLENENVGEHVPFIINKQLYFFTFHEIEKETKTLNFLPFLFDAALQNKDMDPVLEDAYTSRFGNWYIVLQVQDVHTRDCLHPDYPQRNEIIRYLRMIKQEYLHTQNYYEALLQN